MPEIYLENLLVFLSPMRVFNCCPRWMELGRDWTNYFLVKRKFGDQVQGNKNFEAQEAATL